jgi:hypothetical protein
MQYPKASLYLPNLKFKVSISNFKNIVLMKKIKLMLLSLSIFAIVGGVLAFTTKTGQKNCTAPVNSDGSCPTYCPNLSQQSNMPTTVFICTAATIPDGIDPCHYANGEPVHCGVNSVQRL